MSCMDQWLIVLDRIPNRTVQPGNCNIPAQSTQSSTANFNLDHNNYGQSRVSSRAVSDQILEVGTAWEGGYKNVAVCGAVAGIIC